MNKSELIAAVAAESGLTKTDAEKALNAVTSTVTAAVAKGGEVAILGFGTFRSLKRAARAGKNPATGAPLKIAATTVPKFTPGSAFKAAVAGKKAKKK